MNKLFVLGVGPGSLEYVLPIVYEKVKQCDLLVGGKRNLSLFQEYKKQTLAIGRNIEEVIESIHRKREAEQIGILVSGEPGLYSFMKTLLRYFSRKDLEVVPGISSLQYLFAKGALPWEDAKITSFHGRQDESLADLVQRYPKVALFTDTQFPPKAIIKRLYDQGIQNKRILIGENLSYPDERIIDESLEKCRGIETKKLCVMVIYNEDIVEQ